jgi:hypothetical protein
MAFAGGVQLAGLQEQLAGVLAHGLEQPVSGPPAGRLDDRHQRLVHEACEHIHRQARRDRRSRLRVKAAHEHRQAAKGLLLGWVEELVAPFDGGPHRPVVRRRESSAPAQRPEPGLQTREDLCRGHHADPGGGQLDRQRQAIEPRAQLGDRRVRLLAGHELRPPLPRPLDEQPICILRPERFQPPDRLPADTERFAARGHDPNAAARSEQSGGQLGAGGHHVLAVVQDQQQIAVGQVSAQRIRRSGPARAANVEHPGRLRCDVRCIGPRGEIHEPDSVGPPPDLALGERQGEAGLADTARTRQRHQTRGAQRLADAFELASAPDQGRQRRGQVVLCGARPACAWQQRRRHWEPMITQRAVWQRTPGRAGALRRSARRAAPRPRSRRARS